MFNKMDQNLGLSPVSLDIWAQKYQLKGMDETPMDTINRVADSLGWTSKERSDFRWAMCNGAIPAGRIMSNAGAGKHKPNTSLINCTVSGTIDDSMAGIMDAARDAAMTLKAGCGIGYEFSTLRPAGAKVRGSGASTSGPLPFMDIFDAMCKTVSSAGGRRGAQMATFAIDHPDVEAFIDAKREPGRLRQFNLSLLVTDDFMHAVREDKPWQLVFPLVGDEQLQHSEGRADFEVVYRTIAGVKTPHRVYKTLQAKDLWDKVMRSTYDYAEPGVLFIDTYNKMNPLNFIETIRTTNPCGEQGLPPDGACLLGSVDLTHFVDDPFYGHASFNWDKFEKVVSIFTVLLDRVVERAGLPLPAQQKEIREKRRHGMGITGLGSMLTMMCIKYGSDESVEMVASIMRRMACIGFSVGVDLAKAHGPAPVLMSADFRTAYAQSPYFDHLMEAVDEAADMRYEDLQRDIEKCGSRFTHHTSIAPAGTISLSFGNNCSNGIEPTFAHEYTRNIIMPGEATKRAVTVRSKELALFRQMFGDDEPLPDFFITADEVTPEQHLWIMAVAQSYVDSSISKTINVPTDIPFEQFKYIYTQAWTLGCKGCTTFRFNPDVFAGVLVRVDDLKKTRYTFTLSDGTEVTASGDEEIVYEGKTHTAANLHDAIKDGYYGRL